MPHCADCPACLCVRDRNSLTEAPGGCPMEAPAAFDALMETYRGEEGDFFRAAAAVEAEGYGRWTRLRETAEFCKRMGYRRVGIAFCMGLRNEVKTVAAVLRAHGLEVESAVCKTGGIPKNEAGIPDAMQVRPGTVETMCNPIAQAKLLEERGAEFNVVVGLCVGHDSLFFKYSAAPTTTLIAKDRVLANNPAGAIYCAGGYLRAGLYPE